MRNQILLVVSFLFLSVSAFSHGIHDAGQAKPKKGGVLKTGKHFYGELVEPGNQLWLYVYNKNHEMTPVASDKVSVKALAKLPRKDKSFPVEMKFKKDHWEGSLSEVKSHRYNLEVEITKGEKKSNLKFVVEP